MTGQLKSSLYNLKILGIFIALSLIMRFFSFFPTLLSHDEGTYFVIAQEIFSGKIYFVDVLDLKPIGIFLLLGIFIKIFGSSIFLIRLFAAIVISLTSFIIYKISLYDQKEEKAAIASGIIFIFFLSVYTHFGVFVNPELFYTFFTALGFYIFLRYKKPAGFLAVGVLMGIGFILKYVVLFDIAAWLLLYFTDAWINNERKEIRKAFFNCLLSGLGFLVPFGLLITYYYLIGHLNDFYFYTFKVTSNIPVEYSALNSIIDIGDFHLRFLPLLFFFYYSLFKKNGYNFQPKIQERFVAVWFLMVLLAVIIPGKPFGHYFIQLMVPISIIAGRFFREDIIKPSWLNKLIHYPIGTILFFVLIICNVFMQKADYFNKHDVHKEVAGYLKPLIKAEDKIYTGNYQQVLYFLLQKECPVKYVHRTLICNPEQRGKLKIDIVKEMKALMDTNFKYILMQGPYCFPPMNEHLLDNYRIVKTFRDDIVLYERLEGANKNY